jgi:hypothetical protein
MFGQLFPNKNKFAIMWRDTYYANFASKVWNLNQASVPESGLPKCYSARTVAIRLYLVKVVQTLTN